MKGLLFLFLLAQSAAAASLDWRPNPAHFYRVYVRQSSGAWAQIDRVEGHGYYSLASQRRHTTCTYAIRAVDRQTLKQSPLSNAVTIRR